MSATAVWGCAYLPNLPKQEGEPPRAQPSRMNEKRTLGGRTGGGQDVEPQRLA